MAKKQPFASILTYDFVSTFAPLKPLANSFSPLDQISLNSFAKVVTLA